MTREEAKEAAEVMLAYAEGKEIQYKNHEGDSWCEIVYGEPEFNWDRTEYRIKPEPTYRPFKDKEECWNEMLKHQPFGWVIDKESEVYHNIISLNNICVYFPSEGGEYFERMMTIMTFADGTPFGIKEEEK